MSNITDYPATEGELPSEVTILEVAMLPLPFTALVPDRRAYVLRAHRLRSAVVAGLLRDLARLARTASR